MSIDTETRAEAAPEQPTGARRLRVRAGLEGVVVADTTIGDVRGEQGFFHYRGHDAVELARLRPFEDVWHLLAHGELPDAPTARAFASHVAAMRELPAATRELIARVAPGADPLVTLRTVVSDLGGRLGWSAGSEPDSGALVERTVQLVALVPTVLAALHRVRLGQPPVPPRADLGHVENYLWMLHGSEPTSQHARALEQYLVLTADHGFNSSTFTARVITSTGADLAAAICGAIGALSGPLHGGAPSRALDMLDQIGDASAAAEWVRASVASGERIMGFGHRIYRTDDPRSVLLRQVAADLGGDTVQHALGCESQVVTTLAELKPGRSLYTNVEFYAGVVMEACGIPRDMFTATFAASRVAGWCAHVVEQSSDNRLIRPDAAYVGPAPARPLPAA